MSKVWHPASFLLPAASMAMALRKASVRAGSISTETMSAMGGDGGGELERKHRAVRLANFCPAAQRSAAFNI